MLLVDTHNHLGCDAFNSDRIQVINRSNELGVKRHIMIGVFPNEWENLIQLANEQSSLYCACGLHPLYLPPDHAYRQSLDKLCELFEKHPSPSKLCALGEVGLDHLVDYIDNNYQQLLFKEQLAIATSFKLPVLLHVRRAHSETFATLKHLKFKEGGIVHAFSGSYEEAINYIRLGFKIGLGGAGTWPQAHRMQRVLKQLPMEAIVLETDAPDMPPFGREGQRNSPEYLPEICQQLAQIKEVSVEELAKISTENVCQLFNWELSSL